MSQVNGRRNNGQPLTPNDLEQLERQLIGFVNFLRRLQGKPPVIVPKPSRDN